PSSSSSSLRLFSLHLYAALRDLHSFPTRRSSDLHRVEALDERQGLLPAIGVVPVLPDRPQVVLPQRGDRAAQSDDARLHRLSPPNPTYVSNCGNEGEPRTGR